MKIINENNTLTIFFEGRVDTKNAMDVEKEIFDAISDKTEELVIDASNLEYISSSGLRILMKLYKKRNKKFTVQNVSPNIYDILEITGFVAILNIKRSLRKVSV